MLLHLLPESGGRKKIGIEADKNPDAQKNSYITFPPQGRILSAAVLATHNQQGLKQGV
jgi:hypothetical protein